MKTRDLIRAAVLTASLAPAAHADAPATTTTNAKAQEHLKVLVLDVSSTELTASEKVTLANLEAAHLSEESRLDVLSGEDVKQLVALQGQAQEIGVNGNCTDACMAELAGALGAGVVIATQAGKLGDTLVVTLAVFDAAKAKSVSRKSITATSLGELPGKLGPALDALVEPLLPARPTSVATVSTPPAQTITTTTTAPAPRPDMSGRVLELYGAQAIQICIDQNDRSAWWFCDAKQAYTENNFVRKYRELTGAHDADKGDVNRAGIGGIALPIGMFALGGVGLAAVGTTVACGGIGACDPNLNDLFSPDNDEPLPFILGLSLGVSAGVAGVTLGFINIPGEEQIEGTPQMHTLTEGEGRSAAARYNDALRDKLTRDLGAS